jgi:hypothetical protein
MSVVIRYHRTLEFVGSMNLLPKVTGFWYPIAKFRPQQPPLDFNKTGQNLIKKN